MPELFIVCIDDKPQYWSSTHCVLLNCGYSPTVFCSEQEARTAIDSTVVEAIKESYDTWAIVSGGKVTIHKLLSCEVCTVALDIESARREGMCKRDTTRQSFPNRLLRILKCLLRK